MSEHIQEGEEQGGPSIDSDAGFQAFLAGQTGAELTEEQIESISDSDRSIAGGLEEESAPRERPRDEKGRYAPAAQSEEPAEEEVAPTEEAETEEEQVDPSLAQLLERHGGDPNVALQAVLRERDEAQSLIGRQSAEVGEVRKTLEQQQRQLQELMQRPQTPQTPPPLPGAGNEVEALENLYEQQGGRQMMNWVVNNRPDLIESAEEVWAADDPLNATGFRSARIAYEITNAREAQAPQAPQQDRFVESLRMERQLSDSVRQVKEMTDPAEWTLIRPHMEGLVEDTTVPEIIRKAAFSSDPSTQVQGIQALAQIARGRAIQAATEEAKKETAVATTAKKKLAGVATGSLRPVAERKPSEGEPQTSEEIAKAFHAALLGTETTDVFAGLVEERR